MASAVGGGPTSLATTNTTREAFAQPLAQLPPALRESFQRGRSLFRQNWVIAPAADAQVDGLGPFYNRISCIACHSANGKGHAPDGPNERAGALLVRLSVPGVDGHGGPKPHPVYGDQFREASIPGVPAPGRVSIAWPARLARTVTLAGGATVRLRAPQIRFHALGYGPLQRPLTSARIGPAVFGLGLLEAVPDEVLEQLAREAKPDGVKGRLNRVYDSQSGTMVYGRFGLKANRSTLRDQIAGAMAGDLGITSPLYPQQGCTAGQHACLAAPTGGEPELTAAQLDDLETYLNFLAPPAPRTGAQRGQAQAGGQAPPPRDQIRHGAQLFATSGCVVCHRPQLPLGAHPQIPGLAGASIAPYTDLLLHDMGPGLADGRPDYAAGGRDWRTAPLWGAGLLRQMNERAGYLHDGRARDLQEAILWHGGEGGAAQRRYVRLSAKERDALLAFINSL
ncbi:MAG: di-heme oxidoredictase family protein [Pseudomonadota bacterium]